MPRRSGNWWSLNLGVGLLWLKARPKVVFWTGGISIALAFLLFSGATAAGAALLAWAALRQAATATDRHQAQIYPDQQRRITESFSKGIEQLGSDKLEVRLGGIYSLERISKENPDDYWTVVETLTAFVRERARWRAPDVGSPDVGASEAIDQDEDVSGRLRGDSSYSGNGYCGGLSRAYAAGRARA